MDICLADTARVFILTKNLLSYSNSRIVLLTFSVKTKNGDGNIGISRPQLTEFLCINASLPSVVNNFLFDT